MDLFALIYRKYLEKVFTKFRKWLLLVMSGKMRVIINCDVYDDVVEYNSKNGKCFIKNCNVHSLDRYVETQIDRYEMNRKKGVVIKGNTFVLTAL